MKFNRNTVTREALEAAGYIPKTVCRGAGIYSNDEIFQTELKDMVWNTIITGLRNNDPTIRIEKKVLLKEIHIYADSLFDGYRGTDIIRYLSRPMSDEEWRTEQERNRITLQQRVFAQTAHDVAVERNSVY